MAIKNNTTDHTKPTVIVIEIKLNQYFLYYGKGLKLTSLLWKQWY